MEELKVFENAEFGSVRTTTVNGEIMFVGKDVAEILEYQNGSRDINRHVDEEDRRKMMIFDGNQNKETIIINESGLYSLILSSKLPSAKEFKHWVTSEVLPSIRKNGAYIRNQENMTPAEIVARGLIAAQKIINEKEKEIAILNGRCGLLTQAVDAITSSSWSPSITTFLADIHRLT